MKTSTSAAVTIVAIFCALPLSAQAPPPPRPATAVSTAIGHPVGPLPGPARSAQRVTKNPFADDDAARQTGRRLFVAMNCAGCHGDHAGGGMGPSLRDADWIYGKEPADIFDSIAEGRAHGMPAWGALLPPEVVWQLVTYLQSLRTPEEPEPPE